jgi:small-conductance mechanosensitive channel
MFRILIMQESVPEVIQKPVSTTIDYITTLWQYASDWFINGFTLGEVTIKPGSLLLGFIILYALLKVSKKVKLKLETQWLVKARLSKSNREAFAVLFWYIAIVISIFVGMSIAGINITNLALIAGALSVGIGFGLQNIVSNFISGIIILFEQPIKKGDWIKVGSTEGIVREINIRSTRVQTHDRSDVIVPNSDIVTNQVTNWMLSDAVGRVKVPIGVAYGSDVDLVRNILLDIAKNHSQVVQDNPELLPMHVNFLSFGDSALNFELRFFITDIANVFKVVSEINFEIVRQFEKHNVSIPFPQRDVHIHYQENKPSIGPADE